MLIEQRTNILLPDSSSIDGCHISPGQTLRVPFRINRSDLQFERRLRVIGEVDVFWKWRDEAGFPELVYRSIEDALDTEDTHLEKYSLKINGHGEKYSRNAWMKIFKADMHPGENYRFEVFAKAQDLNIGVEGEALVEIGIYLDKHDRHANDAFDQPDMVQRICVPPGSYEWKSFRADFTMPANAVLLLIRIGVKNIHGTIRFSTPNLHVIGEDNRIPPLEPNNPLRKAYNWLGENLSRKEWPEFDLKIDGEIFFNGRVFNAIFRHPDFEVPLPHLDTGEHILELNLCADYQSALPFIVQALEILECSARDFEVIAFPEYAVCNSRIPVFLKTMRDNLRLFACGCKNIVPEASDVLLDKAGYHVLFFQVGSPGTGNVLNISDESRTERFEIKQVVKKNDDGIRLSTGDAVYVAQTPDAFMRYLEWYCRNRVGNALCFRPVYRWSGSRELNPEAWQTIIPYLEKLGIFYSLMVDGRELPGKNANPPDCLLDGPFSLGRQAHEKDGAFCYWGNFIWSSDKLPEPFADIFLRSVDRGGIHSAIRPVRKENKAWWFFDPENVADMRQASECFVEKLRLSKAESTRHTGPSTLFRYFYQAGYEVLGAEQMYGPEEVILSALRGAAKAYGKDTYSAHLAVQWSSGPHDTQQHADRYFLSLATCYMHGVKQINTEEGLWRMEANYAKHDRFSRNCLRHLAAHEKFRRFAECHERRGKIHVPIGILQGRFDGWRCFGRGNVWMRHGDDWKFGQAEESFDLLKVFYPRSLLDGIYRFPCPVEPQGWYSGTPFGAVDLLPVEAPAQIMNSYRVIAFLGWNTYDQADFKKLLAYVRKGGKLILAKPHISSNVMRSMPAAVHPDKILYELLGKNFGNASGIIRRSVGEGNVVYFADDSYPASSLIRTAYENELANAAFEVEVLERRKGWIRGSEDVNFTVYDRNDEDVRDIYILNVDWWSGRKSAKAALLLADVEFEIEAKAATMETIAVGSGVAVMPQSHDTDVIGIKNTDAGVKITTQSATQGEIKVFNGHTRETLVFKTGSGVCDMVFDANRTNRKRKKENK
jgi:hypothetical protein